MGKLMRGVGRVQSGQSETGMEHLVIFNKNLHQDMIVLQKSFFLKLRYEIRIYDNNNDTDNVVSCPTR